MFALLTRLKPSKKSGLSLMTKLKLYDGEKQVGDWDQKHVRESTGRVRRRGHARRIARAS
jgi:predicted Ser/Thr protein kinase